uniref:peptidylprolyl isomerase n=1 Tax=Pseudictyota dubia TaxID=2749911 RepID=A0A6U2CAF5_9STRA|mmetsp:Transcript_23639/g.43681  ORF Transcript_23639/g.43681 Transcript_23639/m.43681 type:complete len:348 (+) Transcript_23639:100-1143(+)|eukprot:CAMPEP_0197443940 /NCGR_PEP_ID=MMETSP1175-20131217/9555_1 /TAXON_ID=1003142 /ORGANISM="Triceratium dubium, Strain CCMP147" /LENGTH=347 /DNA_ID=CAMNT_0042974651 /DNA_START=99 /DNA_END=1142 /DNA_ORIENTATION=+
MRFAVPAFVLAASTVSPFGASAFHVSRPAKSVQAARPTVVTSGAFLPQQQGGQQQSRQRRSRPQRQSSASATALRAEEDAVEGVGEEAMGGEEGKEEYKIPVEEGTHDELLYALGVNLARQIGDVRPLVESGEELTQVARGLLDSVVGRLDDTRQRQLLSSRGKDLDELIVDRANKIRQRMEEQGRAMLQNMADTPNIIKLDSGVLIDVLEHGPDGPGQGTRPTAASSVEVHYHGTLPDGTVFDSTLGGEPAKFALGQVIPGWKDALLAMHEGETAVIGIPPDQGYGEMGTPDGRIPGGATLFFKVSLKEVLTAGIGGSPTLLGADGKKISGEEESTGLLGADGRPL